MAVRPIRCPKGCGTLADGNEFEIVVPYRAASSNQLVRVDEDGTLVLGYGDAGQPERFGVPQIACQSCGHQWRMDRAWRTESLEALRSYVKEPEQ